MSKKGPDTNEISLKGLEAPLQELSKPVEKRVNAMMNLHDECIEVYKKYQEEVRAIENKYMKEHYAPLFAKRSSILTGKYEPTAEEAKYVRDDEEEEEESEKDERPETTDEKGIPNFWLTALENNTTIASAIFEADNEALSFMTDIRCSHFEKKEEKEIGFELQFHFAENPYFTDSVLTKKYFMEHDDMFGELALEHAEGCKINWKSGKNLTVKTVKKKVTAKASKGKKGASRVVEKEETCESFFNFFAPPQVPEEDVDEEEEEELQQLIEMDLDIGSKIKEEIVPFAILWFTGEAAAFEDDGFGEFGDFDGLDDDEEGDEDDDEEDDDEDDEPKRGGRGGKGGRAGAPAGKQSSIPQPQQPECKQQ